MSSDGRSRLVQGVIIVAGAGNTGTDNNRDQLGWWSGSWVYLRMVSVRTTHSWGSGVTTACVWWTCDGSGLWDQGGEIKGDIGCYRSYFWDVGVGASEWPDATANPVYRS